jgi:hypothetical protein
MSSGTALISATRPSAYALGAIGGIWGSRGRETRHVCHIPGSEPMNGGDIEDPNCRMTNCVTTGVDSTAYARTAVHKFALKGPSFSASRRP